MDKKREILLDDIVAHNPATTSNMAVPDIETIRNRWDFEKLYLDIMKNGVKEPIWVVHRKGTENGKYEVVDGLQRLRAVEQLGLEKIPAFIEIL